MFGPTASLPIVAAPFFYAAQQVYPGKPIIIRAEPQNFTFRADLVRFDFSVSPQGFTFRGNS